MTEHGFTMMRGFGYKTAWLAFRCQAQQQVAADLGLANTSHRDWQTAIDASYDPGKPTVAITPALPGHGGAWVLATGFILAVKTPDIAWLSHKTGIGVQYFASHRVTETHIWARASGGRIERLFGWSGESGEILHWAGRPDTIELDLGLPDVDHVTDAAIDAVLGSDIGEDSVMRVAGHWSIDPQTLEGAPSPGDPLAGTLSSWSATVTLPPGGSRRDHRRVDPPSAPPTR